MQSTAAHVRPRQSERGGVRKKKKRPPKPLNQSMSLSAESGSPCWPRPYLPEGLDLFVDGVDEHQQADERNVQADEKVFLGPAARWMDACIGPAPSCQARRQTAAESRVPGAHAQPTYRSRTLAQTRSLRSTACSAARPRAHTAYRAGTSCSCPPGRWWFRPGTRTGSRAAAPARTAVSLPPVHFGERRRVCSQRAADARPYQQNGHERDDQHHRHCSRVACHSVFRARAPLRA